MKKKSLIATIALATCLTAGFASCSKDPEVSEPTTYTLTFYVGGGEDNLVYNLQAGEGIEVPETPDREYYDFLGWYADAALTVPYTFGTMPEANTAVYAKWSPKQRVRFYFNANGGNFAEGTSQTLVFDVGEETAAVENVPTKYGYKFDGWCEDAAGKRPYAFGEAPEADVTLYAKWKKDQSAFYYASFVVDGAVVGEVPVLRGETLTPYSFEEDGLVVSEWYTEAEQTFDFSVALSGNVQLTGYPHTQGLTFSGDTVTGYTGENESVTIPSRYAGKTVAKIADGAFRNSAIVKANLPDTIVTLGAYAFADCAYLKEINVPVRVTEIGAYAFYRDVRLQSTITLTSLSKLNESTFNSCEKLTKVVFGENISEIGAYAFAGCSSLSEATLQEGVKTLGAYAFNGCSALTTFTLPASLNALGSGALTECSALETVEVAQGNTAFSIGTDGCLYADSGKTFVLYMKNSDAEFTVTGAQKILSGAFCSADNLTSLTLDTSVTEVEIGALRGAKNLETLTLPFLGASATEQDGYLSYAFGAEVGLFNGETGKFTPASLRKVTLTKDLTYVPAYAFYGCTGLKEVVGISTATAYGYQAFAYTGFETFEIPATVTRIGVASESGDESYPYGHNVFGGCKFLTAINAAQDNTAFTSEKGCLYTKDGKTLLAVPAGNAEAEIAASAQKIETCAFFDTQTSRVVVPDTVQEIAYAAFYRCAKIAEMTVPFIGGSATENQYMLYVFGGVAQLTSNGMAYGNVASVPALLRKVVYTGDAATLPDDAFAYCQGLKEATYPNTVTSIGARAFYKTSVEALQLGTGVTEIGEYAFASTNLEGEVYIPSKIQTIGAYAFAHNQSVTKAEFAEGITTIPEGAFAAYESTSGSTSVYYSSLTEIVIPASVTSIGAGAFYYAGSNYDYTQERQQSTAVSLTIASGSALKMIGANAFTGSGVKKIALPSTVEEIGVMAFFACDLLEEVEIGTAQGGSRLSALYAAAFGKCDALLRFTLHKAVNSAADVPTVYTEIESDETTYECGLFFAGDVTDLKIFVHGSDSYRAAHGWSDYADNIREIEAND